MHVWKLFFIGSPIDNNYAYIDIDEIVGFLNLIGINWNSSRNACYMAFNYHTKLSLHSLCELFFILFIFPVQLNKQFVASVTK